MMKLKDIQSWALLPQFAEDAAFLQKAFDLIIKPNVERIKSLSQPLSIEAIHALTDDELQLLYDQYGVAEYYPDLDRSVRDMMLYNIVHYYRWLGTPKVMEILCKYIFNGFELEAIVWDNLAWDNGDLVHPELLDMYDVEVIPCGNVLPDNALYRILANIIRFSRNTQTLRDIWFTMPDNDISVSACIGLPYGTSGVINIENYTVCESVQPVIEEHTFCVLDAVTGEELNSTKGVVDHLVCDRYNILEDGGVKHLRVHDGLVGYIYNSKCLK